MAPGGWETDMSVVPSGLRRLIERPGRVACQPLGFRMRAPIARFTTTGPDRGAGGWEAEESVFESSSPSDPVSITTARTAMTLMSTNAPIKTRSRPLRTDEIPGSDKETR